ncbi:MAG TPA: acyl-CoA desaturase [Dehalococcoidia bacterium]|nr:acyl-CoA desaturase [Dehalococcoidia bacterium]
MAISPLASPRPSRQSRHGAHTAAYNRLRAEVTAAGLLDRSPAYYLPLIAASFAIYAVSAWEIYVNDSFFWLTIACAGFCLSTVQIAGLMHDAGHRAVFRSVRLNNLLGVATTGAIGMVFPSWVLRHNLHHAHPNQEDLDPDMEVPFLVLNESDYADKDRIQRFVTRWQAYYYYPLGALVGFSNRLGSITYFLRYPSRANLARLLLYVPAMFLLFAGPFLAFPLDKAAFVFFLIHIPTGVYLANCFAPNHKGMPSIENDADMSFLEQQVVTSRNVRGGLLTDFFLVGLNHQVEHHLFPACPRNKLRHLGPYVRKVCEEEGIPYTAVSFLRTNRMLLGHLHRVSRSPQGPVLETAAT